MATFWKNVFRSSKKHRKDNDYADEDSRQPSVHWKENYGRNSRRPGSLLHEENENRPFPSGESLWTKPRQRRGPQSEPGGYNSDDDTQSNDGAKSEFLPMRTRGRRSRARSRSPSPRRPLRQSNAANSSRAHYPSHDEDLSWAEERIRKLEDKLTRANEKVRDYYNECRKHSRDAKLWRQNYEALDLKASREKRELKDRIRELKNENGILRTKLQMYEPLYHPQYLRSPLYPTGFMPHSATTASSVTPALPPTEGSGESLALQTPPTSVMTDARRSFDDLRTYVNESAHSVGVRMSGLPPMQSDDNTADEMKNFRDNAHNFRNINGNDDESAGT
ncbi:hypothetical protein AAVH_31641 [Aphelenchoides avenae]|nr:hypothetical protein AAVH_31641 [Aphelenchus avenae]